MIFILSGSHLVGHVTSSYMLPPSGGSMDYMYNDNEEKTLNIVNTLNKVNIKLILTCLY